jgi:hypothetical protein
VSFDEQILFNRYGRIFFNPREAHNRATGNVDILGRNKQQQKKQTLELANLNLKSFEAMRMRETFQQCFLP